MHNTHTVQKHTHAQTNNQKYELPNTLILKVGLCFVDKINEYLH